MPPLDVFHPFPTFSPQVTCSSCNPLSALAGDLAAPLSKVHRRYLLMKISLEGTSPSLRNTLAVCGMYTFQQRAACTYCEVP